MSDACNMIGGITDAILLCRNAKEGVFVVPACGGLPGLEMAMLKNEAGVNQTGCACRPIKFDMTKRAQVFAPVKFS